MTTRSSGRDERSAVDKAMSVLRAFGDDAHVGVGVSELARRTGLSKSTTFRLLGELESSGAVEHIGTAYRLGALFDDLTGISATPMHDLVRDTLTPFLADLYEATRLTVQVAALRRSHVVYLNKLEGHQRLRSPSRIGGRMPAYCTAVGKVLLAGDALAAEETMRMPRHRWTPHTIIEADRLAAELERVRVSGIAYDHGESLETLACLAAPVRGANGRVIAAMSVSGELGSFQPMRVEAVLRRVAFAASQAMAGQQRAQRQTAAVA